MRRVSRGTSSLVATLMLSGLFAAEGSHGWIEGVAASPAANPHTADFFVSPSGQDRWLGRLADPDGNDGPFATVSRARDAVRALLKTRKEPRPVRVALRGGTYYLDQPLEFGPEDSGVEGAPVVFAAAAGEKAVLSGGRRIENGRWGELNGMKIWVMDIPEVKAGTWRFRQLFVNGERRPRTRLPKQGEYRIESLPGYTGDFLRSPTKQFVYASGDIVPTWRNLRDVEIVGITRWLDNRLPIARVDPEHRTVTFDRTSLFALVETSERPSVYWVENVFEALDTPGQWYLDRPRGVLYYLPRPGEEMPSAEVIAPRLTQVLRVVGRAGATVHDLQFEGLVFAHTEWQPPADYASSLQAGVEVPGALLFDYAERCAVTGGGIEHVGNCGVEVNVGCADIEIARNQITDIGAGGIRIGHFFSWETEGAARLTERGVQRKAAMPKGPHSERITVADNEIAHCGRFTAEAVGVFVGDNANNKVIHNHIHDVLYSGISVGSVQDFGPSQATGNVIEYNHVHDIGQGMLSDLAGIYTCSTPGSRIAYNVVHDVVRREYGGWGIYPDEGSHDTLIQKNLIYRCQDGALFAHHNHDITAENNIFAFNRTAQVDRGGIGGFELICQRNLIYYMEGKAVGDHGSGNCGPDVCAFDHNLYWNASGKPVLIANMSFAEWQAVGQDKDSLIADPLFVDPEHGDFRLRPGSPAARIGFEPWDLSAVGPRPFSVVEKGGMVFPGQAWQQVTPDSQGITQGKLSAAMEYLGHGLSEYGGTGAMLIVRNGYEIWAGPDSDKEYQIFSATKSFTSTVLGLLIQDGTVSLSTLAKDLDPALAEHYPGVTLRHFATMTSGYDSAGGSYEFDAQGRGDSWNPGPAAPPIFPPGSKFRYWDDAMSQFGNVLTRAARRPLDRLFKERIADPIGMKRWRWTENDTPTGQVLSWTGGIWTSSRELARFGHLFLNRGNWKGRQLIDASWVDQATSVQVPATVPNDTLPRSRGAGVYGYNWWVNGVKPDGRRLWPGAPPRTFYANGLHNNVCIVVPEWNIVIARTNGGRKDGSANTPANVDEIWSGFFSRLAEAVAR